MLKPDANDPNYKDQMKQHDKDSSGWGPGGTAPVKLEEPKPAKSEGKK